jgi:glucose-fructose oxidoreductase
VRRIRFALVGLGNFSEKAILPAFGKIRREAELAALVTGDPAKGRRLARRHGAKKVVRYEEYVDFLRTGAVDAVYVVLPNHLHRAFTVSAAEAGVHVLVEKPMAVTSADCLAMIDACAHARVKLMVGYRLHLERATRAAMAMVHGGKIGEPRGFVSHFTFQVRTGNPRTWDRAQGGGPLYDIGLYCINAARHFFRAEPVEALALAATHPDDARFGQVEEQMGVVLRFPGGRLATFTVGFGAEISARYAVLGTRGVLHMENGYRYDAPLAVHTVIGGKARTRRFRPTDHLATQLAYFADCIRRDRAPGPSGGEGLADVRAIEMIYAALSARRAGPRS